MALIGSCMDEGADNYSPRDPNDWDFDGDVDFDDAVNKLDWILKNE